MNLAHAQGARDRFLKLQALGLAVTLFTGVALILGVAFCGNLIIGVWTGLSVSTIYPVLFAVEAFTAGVSNVLLLSCWATNRIGKISVMYVSLQLVGVSISALFGAGDRLILVGCVFAIANVLFGAAALSSLLTIQRVSLSELGKQFQNLYNDLREKIRNIAGPFARTSV
jgi:hypothetical protein